MANPFREINKILCTEMDVRRSARKSRMERIKNEQIKEIMGVKGKPDVIDIRERKRLQWYGHVRRMLEERIPELIMALIPRERRKRGLPKKTWMEGVRAAMTTKKFRARSMEKQREMAFGFRKTATAVKNTRWMDGWMDGWTDGHRLDRQICICISTTLHFEFGC
jgi:hypothetical protein